MRSFDSRVEFEVIGNVDIFATGITSLATARSIRRQTRRNARVVNTQLAWVRLRRPLQSEKMIVAADSDGQQARTVLGSALTMKNADLFSELLAIYRKHGWELRGALLQPATLAELQSHEALSKVPVKEGTVDALWFSRPSHNNREAWELRLLAQTQYALFETFEADETEEERADVKLEMEARLRDYTAADLRGS